MNARGWGVQLHTLDAEKAEFVWANPAKLDGSLSLVLARTEWEALGRPSTMWVNVSHDAPPLVESPA